MLPIRRFLDDTSAATAVEYGLIAGMVACLLVGALQNVGAKLSAKVGKISAAMS